MNTTTNVFGIVLGLLLLVSIIFAATQVILMVLSINTVLGFF